MKTFWLVCHLWLWPYTYVITHCDDEFERFWHLFAQLISTDVARFIFTIMKVLHADNRFSLQFSFVFCSKHNEDCTTCHVEHCCCCSCLLLCLPEFTDGCLKCPKRGMSAFSRGSRALCFGNLGATTSVWLVNEKCLGGAGEPRDPSDHQGWLQDTQL